jgi:hypothetical protein
MPKNNNLLAILHKSLSSALTESLHQKIMDKFGKQLKGKDDEVTEVLESFINEMFAGKSNGKKKGSRPTSGYNMYMKDTKVREAAKKKLGKKLKTGKEGNQQVMAEIGGMWKSLSEKEKKKYTDSAKKVNDNKEKPEKKKEEEDEEEEEKDEEEEEKEEKEEDDEEEEEEEEEEENEDEKPKKEAKKQEPKKAPVKGKK